MSDSNSKRKQIDKGATRYFDRPQLPPTERRLEVAADRIEEAADRIEDAAEQLGESEEGQGR